MECAAGNGIVSTIAGRRVDGKQRGFDAKEQGFHAKE